MMDSVLLNLAIIEILAESESKKVEFFKSGFGNAYRHRPQIGEFFWGVHRRIFFGEVPCGMNVVLRHDHRKILAAIGCADFSLKFA
jgi:hypothetical protein